MTQDAIQEGGCLCGAVRYRVTGAPMWVAHCHCESCRKASGAPVVTFAGYTDETFQYIEGAPARMHSSPGVTRSFCPTCGTPLTYQAERCAGEVHVTVASLDHPEAFPPDRHVWVSERLPWFNLADDLPRHAGFSSGER